MRPIYSKVAGISHQNDDGSSRQDIARKWCRPGTRLVARSEPKNRFDPNAIGLWVRGGWRLRQVGYIGSDLAERLSPTLRAGSALDVTIADRTGGTAGEYVGLNIAILQREAVPSPEPAVPEVINNPVPLAPRKPIPWGKIGTRLIAGWGRSLATAVALYQSAITVYRGLPPWAKPIAWGLGIAAPVVSLMFLARAIWG